MKCNLCDIIINADEKSLLLLDHIKDKHKEVFDVHKDNPEANIGFRIEFLHLNVMKDEEDPKSEPILLGEVCETTSEPLVKVPEPATDKDDEVNTQYVMNKKKKKKDSSEARKRSWVWKYFDKLSNIIYRCNLCHVVLSIKGCNTNNMNRHVRTRHPHVFKKEITQRDTSESFDLSSEVETPYAIKTEEIYASDRDLEDMIESTNQKLRRSWIWSYFERVSAAQAQCKLCRRHITHGGNATGNMNRHLKMIHNKTGYPVDDKNDTSWVWKVFEASDDEAYTCKICQFRCIKYTSEERSVSCMLHHLKLEHGVVSGDQIITGTECDDEH
ncbi:hypothetical protein O3G_MSEX001999 [Manduca sexta]|uniref:BED-type domain-containing protein n=1 Tax=Manduca sexta TaxID=7130 RepID=A0A922CD17_MANSE|nr:hypothetical protein O3G_MSEX001999 [Manduca sexta]